MGRPRALSGAVRCVCDFRVFVPVFVIPSLGPFYGPEGGVSRGRVGDQFPYLM